MRNPLLPQDTALSHEGAIMLHSHEGAIMLQFSHGPLHSNDGAIMLQFSRGDSFPGVMCTAPPMGHYTLTMEQQCYSFPGVIVFQG